MTRRFKVGDMVKVGSQKYLVIGLDQRNESLYLIRKDEGDFWMDEILLSQRPEV